MAAKNPPSLLPSLFLLAALAALAAGECMIFQESLTSKPRLAQGEERIPQLYDTFKDVCPEFVGKKVCCNQYAREIMNINFVKMEVPFPCQTCANNMRRFLWTNQLRPRLLRKPGRIHHQSLRKGGADRRRCVQGDLGRRQHQRRGFLQGLHDLREVAPDAVDGGHQKCHRLLEIFRGGKFESEGRG